MKKSLIALAALAATGLVSAQSSVTISGFANGSVDMFSISKAATARTGNKAENRVSDNATRIIFGVNEDLGGGLSAVVQLDLRPVLDQSGRLNAAGNATTPTPLAGGNSHIGLSSKNLGAVRLGRQDLYYVENGNFAPVSASTIQSHAGLLITAGAGHSVGRASRTANLVWYTSPVINGFNAVLGYSTSGTSGSGTPDVENDMASGQRKGSTQYARLGYAAGPLTLALAMIDEKPDYIGSATVGVTETTPVSSVNAQQNRKGTMITAKYDLGMARVGFALAQNQSQAWTAGALASTGVNKRQNMQFGVGVPMGPHNFALTYTQVGSVKVAGVESADTGATAVALGYGYDFSKRTQLFAGYNRISNQAKAAHSMFYNADNAVGSIGSSALAGERHSAFSLGLRHSF